MARPLQENYWTPPTRATARTHLSAQLHTGRNQYIRGYLTQHHARAILSLFTLPPRLQSQIETTEAWTIPDGSRLHVLGESRLAVAKKICSGSLINLNAPLTDR
jgi:hypothetical protein